MKIYLRMVCAALVAMALYGCGNGKGSAGNPADNEVFPAGKATLVFSAMSTARLASSISGIDFSVILPPGMVPGNGSTGQIDSASVSPGTTLAGTNLAYGSYSASSRKVQLSMATTSDSYRLGEFLRLTCTVSPNTAITLASLKAANEPVSILKVVGYDPATRSTVTLTPSVKVTLGAAR